MDELSEAHAKIAELQRALKDCFTYIMTGKQTVGADVIKKLIDDAECCIANISVKDITAWADAVFSANYSPDLHNRVTDQEFEIAMSILQASKRAAKGETR